MAELPSDITNKNDASTASSQSKLDYWEAAAESCVRVTLAGFAGSLIGLAKERQSGASVDLLDPAQSLSQQRQQRQAKANSKGSYRGPSRPRRPPPVPIKTASTNLPMMWSLSCVMFALVLESSRRASPTDLLWRLATTSDSLVDSDSSHETTFRDQAMRKASVSLGDYAIGGTAAGLAGAYGQQRQLHANRALTVRSGLLTGLGLGLLAGMLQAAIDVANLYLQRNDSEPEHNEQDVDKSSK